MHCIHYLFFLGRCSTTSLLLGGAAPSRTSLTRAFSSTNNNNNDEIDEARSVLFRAVDRSSEEEQPETVIEALRTLEKAKIQGASIADALDGAWRLIFTTGTVETQKKIGKINYFPLKAVQTFDFATSRISNGVYLGPLEIRFFGVFTFNQETRKLEFDFDTIKIFGFEIPISNAAEIGAATGLGSDANPKLKAKGKRPFFNWIDANDHFAAARGGGGGLALWARTTTTSA